MDQSNFGRVVYSKAGRDKGKYFIITGMFDEQYVYVCDGSLRKIESPKLKKIKHLIFKDIISEEIKNLLVSGEKVSNSKINKFLQSIGPNKEV